MSRVKVIDSCQQGFSKEALLLLEAKRKSH